MSFSIPTEFVPFVDQLVSTGAYPSVDAVVFKALQRMREEQSELEELKRSLSEAQNELNLGEGVPFDVDEILAEGRRQFAARHPGLSHGSTHS